MESLTSVLQLNRRDGKPRSRGLTEIRGPYYSVVGPRYLTDVLDTMGAYVDGLKFAGGSFCLMPEERVRELIDLCHAHDVLVSTGGFLERVLPLGPPAVDRCLELCRAVGFDTIEVSSGFVSVPPDDLVRLARRALDLGFRVKPEVGIQFGAGGGSPVEQLEAEPPRDADQAIRMAERYLALGLPLVMIESEGLTENVRSPARRPDCPARRSTRSQPADVRGGRSGGVHVVCQDIRTGRQPVRRSQPDRAARSAALRPLGHNRRLGPSGGIQADVVDMRKPDPTRRAAGVPYAGALSKSIAIWPAQSEKSAPDIPRSPASMSAAGEPVRSIGLGASTRLRLPCQWRRRIGGRRLDEKKMTRG